MGFAPFGLGCYHSADASCAASCRFFETFSYLPPLTDEEIAKQVDYIIRQGWIPCLEFSEASGAYIKEVFNVRFSGTSAGYYDNRCASLVGKRVVRQPCSADPCDQLLQPARAALGL